MVLPSTWLLHVLLSHRLAPTKSHTVKPASSHSSSPQKKLRKVRHPLCLGVSLQILLWDSSTCHRGVVMTAHSPPPHLLSQAIPIHKALWVIPLVPVCYISFLTSPVSSPCSSSQAVYLPRQFCSFSMEGHWHQPQEQAWADIHYRHAAPSMLSRDPASLLVAQDTQVGTPGS